MSNTRIINSILWEDEFFSGLQLFDRLLWIGLITSCADDQGRLQDSPALIRSKIFPTDDIHLESIENAIRNIADQGKIVRYAINGKRMIQIINWWKHQQPRWAGKSAYPPPPGWTDRERYHTKGNLIAECNWNTIGGYLDGYIATYTINDVNVNSDIDINVNSNIDDSDSLFSQLRDAFVKATGIAAFTGNAEVWVKSIKEWEKAGALPVDVPVAVEINLENNLPVNSPKSITKTINTAIAKRVSGVKPKPRKTKIQRNEDTGEDEEVTIG